MNSGKYVFAQVMEFLPRYEFDKLVRKYNGDRRSRHLTSYNHLLHLVFGQLTSCGSLRDICLCLNAHRRSLYHLGFGQSVNESSLSRAGERRDSRIFEELGQVLVRIVRPMYENEIVPDVDLPEKVILALDSTTISCSIRLMSWAYGKYGRGAVKMHTLLDLRGSIPVFIHMTHGKWHDSNMLDVIDFVPCATYVMDKAYVDLKALYRMHKENAFFITRAKSNMRYSVIGRRDVDRATGLRDDVSVRLSGSRSGKLYPEEMRLVRYYDGGSGETLEFITNNLELKAIEVANLYRNRWQIETFFKWVKGNLTVKTLWGHSENAVRIHLWTAICTYLLVARIKAELRCSYSVSEVATLLSVSALEKTSLRELLDDKYNDSSDSNHDVNEPNLFNESI